FSQSYTHCVELKVLEGFSHDHRASLPGGRSKPSHWHLHRTAKAPAYAPIRKPDLGRDDPHWLCDDLALPHDLISSTIDLLLITAAGKIV
ncbi:hypothetical protein, partial [Methylobacterium sp. WL30]|uniref:hypothetical protein n=1 Tax=Methylobacterium sp. WL30 TaxID=2603895 RepID=UPI001AEEE072